MTYKTSRRVLGAVVLALVFGWVSHDRAIATDDISAVMRTVDGVDGATANKRPWPKCPWWFIWC